MKADTEITGPIVLNLWVSSTSADMDIFATLRHINAKGCDVPEVGNAASRPSASPRAGCAHHTANWIVKSRYLIAPITRTTNVGH